MYVRNAFKIRKKTLFIKVFYQSLLAGVTRIELASAVLETVALPLCYTPICLKDYKLRIS